MMTEHSIPTTRTARQAKIVEIINTTDVGSQAELRELLAQLGIVVTQATLSRDLDELHAYKEYSSSAQRVYKVPDVEALSESAVGARAHLDRWAKELLTSVAVAANQGVIRTLPGAAQFLASALDRAVIPGVLGCIAGDDTVFVIAESETVMQRVAHDLLQLVGK